MSFGFQSSGDSGNIQIDSDHQSYSLLARGVGPDPNSFEGFYVEYGAFTSEYPLILVRPVGSMSKLTSFNVRVQHSLKRLFLFPSTIEWAIFVPNNSVSEPVGGWGMRTWSAAGVPTFNSLKTPMDVIQTVSYGFTGANDTTVLSFPYSGNRPYVLANNIVPMYGAAPPSFGIAGISVEYTGAQVRMFLEDAGASIVDQLDLSQPRTFITADFHV